MTTLESAAEAIARPAVGFTRAQTLAVRLWAPLMFMGLILSAAAFVLGVINGLVAADYFAFSLAEREAAASGTDIVEKRIFIESVGAWLPELNFLGLGLVLTSILQLFTIILGSLRVSGATVQQSLGVTVILPGPPITARLFPLFTLAGLTVLVAALVLGVVQGLIASGYWSHSIAAELNPATPGDPLLSTLGTLESMDRWVEPIKFVGLALLLAAAGLAAASVIWVMRFQSRRLLDILTGRP